jgi:acetolactate synthase I/III small subunit
MTIVVDRETNIDQVFRQMYKIVEVIKIKKLNEDKAIIRDLALAKIKINLENKTQINKNCKKFQAKILEKNDKFIIVELCDDPQRIENFLEAVQDLGLVEFSRSGATAVSM